MLIVKRYIGKPVLALELPTIEIALRPKPGRTELVVLVGIGASGAALECCRGCPDAQPHLVVDEVAVLKFEMRFRS